MRFVDSHAHLDGDHFAELEPFLERARAAGLTDIVCIGASDGVDSNPRTVELVQKHEGLFATVGIHPHDARLTTDEVVAGIRELVRRPKVVAVGEIGLDYHYDYSPRDQQRAAFRRFLDLAREEKKPVVIHTREAEDDTLAILRDAGAESIGGVLHCFTGTEKLAQGALELGFYISFSGVLTFKTAEPLRAIARDLPRDRVMIETDCPFLAPIPKRGKPNEPSYIVHTASCLASLWQVEDSEVRRTTSENAIRLFKL
jgi:TatD DNase family protein